MTWFNKTQAYPPICGADGVFPGDVLDLNVTRVLWLTVGLGVGAVAGAAFGYYELSNQ